MVLTEIELRVAELAAHGVALDAIAEALGVSPDEAATHLTRIYRKLGPRLNAKSR